jgi:hypothetical protein
MGFAHKEFKDPRNGVQLQFGLSRNGVEFNGIWIEGSPQARNARIRAQEQLISNFGMFRNALKKLPKGYYIALYHYRKEHHHYEWDLSDVISNTERLRLFLTRMGDKENNVAIAAHLAKTEAIRLGDRLPVKIAENFEKLLPLYSLMIQRSAPESLPRMAKVHPIMLDPRTLRERWKKTGSKGRQGHLSITNREIDREGARRAERVVYDNEKKRLRQISRPDLARRVKDVTHPPGRGFDIQSYSDQGQIIRIEVKSTKAKRISSIMLTSREWEVAKKFGESYHVYLVFRPRAPSPEILPITNFSGQVKRGRIHLEPNAYVARLC